MLKQWLEIIPLFMLSFDIYKRHRFASDTLKKGGCNKILDVGGRRGRYFKRFLPDKESWTLDLEEGNVIGDGKNLPFFDNTFDGVTCIATLQYVPKKLRKKFVHELIRVTKTCVIISVPVDSFQLNEAEKRCNNFYYRIYKKENKWLEKHIKNGLPTMEELKSILQGYDVTTYFNGYLKRWEKMLKLNFILLSNPIFFLLHPVLNGIYNLFYYSQDNRGPSHSQVFVVKV